MSQPAPIPRLALAGLLALALGACAGKPEGVQPVSNFDADRYLGKWYEIARLDHRFERSLSHVTAEYSKAEDAAIRVVNRGYDTAEGEWKLTEGKATFVEGPDVGYLKVSFFGPFGGSYVVADLDPAYQHALVTGNDRSYLWILARTPTIDEATKKRLLQKAQALDYDTSKLIWVEQTGQPPKPAG